MGAETFVLPESGGAAATDIVTIARRSWCPDANRYDCGKCGWPLCGCPDETLSADDLRLRIKILCNTIATGESAEDECYRQIGKLLKRLEALA